MDCEADIVKHEETLNLDQPRDFVDMFLIFGKQNKENGKSFVTRNSLNGTINNLYVGGLLTGGILLSWLILLMLKHQDIQKRLKEEVDRVIGRDILPTLDDRESLHFVKAYLLETHRYTSMAPLGIYHRVKEDKEFRGYNIPGKSFLIPNYWAVHHDERVFPDPFQFNPSRFIDEKGEFVRSRAVIPFSTGIRSCPGETMIQRESFLFIAQLVQRYDILPPEGIEASTINTEGVYDAGGLWPPNYEARFVPRKS